MVIYKGKVETRRNAIEKLLRVFKWGVRSWPSALDDWRRESSDDMPYRRFLRRMLKGNTGFAMIGARISQAYAPYDANSMSPDGLRKPATQYGH